MKPPLRVLALGLLLTIAREAMAQNGGGTEPCVTKHQFEPGPIVNGHHRQPTPGEVEARTQQPRAWSQASTGSCFVAPATPPESAGLRLSRTRNPRPT
jgi:hypothetical protein